MHLTNGSNSLHFFYDAQNKPAVVLFNGIAYTYLYNLQSDVIALIDVNISEVIKYKYDAWGKPISKTSTLASTLGTVQPFRYRRYVYDEETELYYLKNRYYSPVSVRFVNSDGNWLNLINRSSAYALVKFSGNYVGPETHRGSKGYYLPHYHVRHGGSHVFFLGGITY